MPLLANFVGTLAGFFASFFARFMSFNLALKYASWVAWSSVIVGYFVSALVCLGLVKGLFVSGLGALGAPSASNWVGYFGVGLGMLIPDNAPALLGCMATVWITTQVAKIQKQGIEQFSK